MLIIRQIAKDIACNIREAEDKIGVAYSIRDEFPEEADWYKHMAIDHLEFNDRAHNLIADLIKEHRETAHPEYIAGMQAVWDAEHKELIADAARVKALIESF